MKTLCFKIHGDFAHFKPYYTTSSPTTLSLIPPTAIFGIIGAILGMDKHAYYQILKDAGTCVGVGIIGATKKTTMGINLINTKGGYWVPTGKNTNGPRTQIRYEFIKYPQYLIFVSMQDTLLLDKLADMIRQHKSTYTPYLGLSELIADFSMVFYEDAQCVVGNDSFCEFDSALTVDSIKFGGEFTLQDGICYSRERYVAAFEQNRIPAWYVDAFFSLNEKKVKAKLPYYYRCNGYNFLFLNECVNTANNLLSEGE